MTRDKSVLPPYSNLFHWTTILYVFVSLSLFVPFKSSGQPDARWGADAEAVWSPHPEPSAMERASGETRDADPSSPVPGEPITMSEPSRELPGTVIDQGSFCLRKDEV